MRRLLIINLWLLLIPAVMALADGGKGSGEFSTGYIFIDDEGDPSVNYPTFNEYEGIAVSLDNFRYAFENGLIMNAGLKNISLNNRNMRLSVHKFGLFGLDFFNNQYRRIYGGDGSVFTRRNRTAGSAWFYPVRYIKIFGGGSLIGRSGSATDLFDPREIPVAREVDYKQFDFNGGFQLQHDDHMLRVEYAGINYDDDADVSRDQHRKCVRVNAYTTVPNYEWIILTGGYNYFQTEYDNTDFSYESNIGWGGARFDLPYDFALSYRFFFNRAGSDSDLVKTDNFAHTVYLMKTWKRCCGLTVGYQNDINDDYETEVNSDFYYFSGWVVPLERLEILAEVGARAEKVVDGTRLLGHQDRNRYLVRVKYSRNHLGSAMLKLEDKTRENESLSSKIRFNRMTASVYFDRFDLFNLTAGYSISSGDYENATEEFEFLDHLVRADVRFREYRHLTVGGGIDYYRSKRDLDIERINLHFFGSYDMKSGYFLEVEYEAHNYDDFMEINQYDRYYTANITEVRLKKKFNL